MFTFFVSSILAQRVLSRSVPGSILSDMAQLLPARQDDSAARAKIQELGQAKLDRKLAVQNTFDEIAGAAAAITNKRLSTYFFAGGCDRDYSAEVIFIFILYFSVLRTGQTSKEFALRLAITLASAVLSALHSALLRNLSRRLHALLNGDLNLYICFQALHELLLSELLILSQKLVCIRRLVLGSFVL